MSKEHQQFFFQRYRSMQEASLTHPYAQWVTVMDGNTDPACAALAGKFWLVSGAELKAVAERHFASDPAHCRCRLKPLMDAP